MMQGYLLIANTSDLNLNFSVCYVFLIIKYHKFI